MALYLQVIIVAEHPLVPFYGFARALYVAVVDFPWHLAGEARRTDNQSLVVTLQVVVVGTRLGIETVDP